MLVQRLTAWARGEPPPVSDEDIDRAERAFQNTTAEELARSRDAARRAITALRRVPEQPNDD